MMTEISSKTIKGLPRPRVAYEGKLIPVPWNVAGNWPQEVADGAPIKEHSVYWGAIDRISDKLCQVCGETVSSGEITIFVQDWFVVDRGPLHSQCADIAERFCPYLKESFAKRIDCVISLKEGGKFYV